MNRKKYSHNECETHIKQGISCEEGQIRSIANSVCTKNEHENINHPRKDIRKIHETRNKHHETNVD